LKSVLTNIDIARKVQHDKRDRTFTNANSLILVRLVFALANLKLLATWNWKGDRLLLRFAFSTRNYFRTFGSNPARLTTLLL